MRRVIFFFGLLLISLAAAAKNKAEKASGLSPLSTYLRTYVSQQDFRQHAAGSLWSADSVFGDLSADDKAKRLNDVLTINIVEQTVAQSKADVGAQRTFDASSGVTALFGKINTAGIQSLFSPTSASNLQGKGSASSSSQMSTKVAGRIVSVLPNGVLVVEAERHLKLNNETQIVLLRGMVRPADVLADNSVPSTALANLEIELKGKGVVSDATRPPNRLVRALLWLVGF